MVLEIVGNFFLSVENGVGIVLPHIFESFPEFIIFTLGIAIYGIIIYNFYRFASKRDIFHLKFIEKHRIKKTGKTHSRVFNFLLSMLKYGLIFPVIVFFWFAGFSLLLFFLSKSISIEMILLISITIVSAIRITSYYKEDLSRDLAKTLPLALLAIALTDPNFFSFDLVWGRVETVSIFIPKMIAYVLFTISIEWILRVMLFVKRKIFGLFKQADLETFKEES
jgi:hypothetical protein